MLRVPFASVYSYRFIRKSRLFAPLLTGSKEPVCLFIGCNWILIQIYLDLLHILLYNIQKCKIRQAKWQSTLVSAHIVECVHILVASHKFTADDTLLIALRLDHIGKHIFNLLRPFNVQQVKFGRRLIGQASSEWYRVRRAAPKENA